MKHSLGDSAKRSNHPVCERLQCRSPFRRSSSAIVHKTPWEGQLMYINTTRGEKTISNTHQVTFRDPIYQPRRSTSTQGQAWLLFELRLYIRDLASCLHEACICCAPFLCLSRFSRARLLKNFLQTSLVCAPRIRACRSWEDGKREKKKKEFDTHVTLRNKENSAFLSVSPRWLVLNLTLEK